MEGILEMIAKENVKEAKEEIKKIDRERESKDNGRTTKRKELD